MNLRDKVEGLMKAKKDLRDLQQVVADEEHQLVKDLAQIDPDMLSINWGRLLRVTGVTPMKYR